MSQVASLFGGCLFATSTSRRPTLGTAVANAAIAVGFTIGACAWMVATGEDVALDELERQDRHAVERFFVTNGLGFFVGWSWLVVARHLASIAGRQHGISHAGAGGLGEAGAVVVLGPLLTLLLLYATRRSTAASRDGTQLDMTLGRRIRAARLRRKVVIAFQTAQLGKYNVSSS